MVWQQYVYLIIFILGVVARIGMAGKPKTNTHWESGGELLWMLAFSGLFLWLILSIEAV